MIEAVVAVLTLIPILTGALLGYRLGFLRLFHVGGPTVLGWACGIPVAILGLRAGWFWPCGLLTPVFLGLGVAIAARYTALRAIEATLRRAPQGVVRSSGKERASRAAGGILGATAGTFVAASIWLFTLLGVGALSARGAGDRDLAGEAPGMLQSLLVTANRGFVRHIPGIGPLGDEVEALTYILNLDSRTTTRFVRESGWEKLADLPSLRAVYEDSEILRDLAAVRRGNLAALYRLQKSARIIAVFEEPEVKALILDTRPSTLAEKLRKIEARRVTSDPAGGR